MASLTFAAPLDDPLDGEVEVWLTVAGFELLGTPRDRADETPAPGTGLMTLPIDLAVWGLVAVRQAIREDRGAYSFPDGGDLLFKKQDDRLLLHVTGHTRREPSVVVGITAASLEREWRAFAERLRETLAVRNPALLDDPDWRYLDVEPEPPATYWRAAFAGHEACFRSVRAVEEDKLRDAVDRKTRYRQPEGVPAQLVSRRRRAGARRTTASTSATLWRRGGGRGSS